MSADPSPTQALLREAEAVEQRLRTLAGIAITQETPSRRVLLADAETVHSLAAALAASEGEVQRLTKEVLSRIVTNELRCPLCHTAAYQPNPHCQQHDPEKWRIAAATEQTMHAAWRKRAEQVESELSALKVEAAREGEIEGVVRTISWDKRRIAIDAEADWPIGTPVLIRRKQKKV